MQRLVSGQSGWPNQMEFDPYYSWLGIPPHEQPPNYYRLLGLNLFEQNREAISNAADRQMAHLRTYQTGLHGAESQRLLNEVAQARICLLDFDEQLAYDAQLRSRLARTLSPSAALPVSVPTALPDNPIPSSAFSTPLMQIDLLDVRHASYPSQIQHAQSAPIPISDNPLPECDEPKTAAIMLGSTKSKGRPRTNAIGQIAQIIGGGLAGVVLSLLVMQYLLHIDVQQLFSLPKSPQPRLAKKRNVPQPKLPSPSVAEPRIKTEVRTDEPSVGPSTSKARAMTPPHIKRDVPDEKPPIVPATPIIEEDFSTARASLQVEVENSRLLIPTEAELSKVQPAAEKILADVRAKAKSDPLIIAHQLIVRARGKDPALRYRLLIWAAEAAQAAVDAQLMTKIIDSLSREQSINGLSTKAKMLQEIAPNVDTSEQMGSFIDATQATIKLALSKNDLETAEDLARLAAAACDRTGDAAIRERIIAMQHDVAAKRGERKGRSRLGTP